MLKREDEVSAPTVLGKLCVRQHEILLPSTLFPENESMTADAERGSGCWDRHIMALVLIDIDISSLVLGYFPCSTHGKSRTFGLKLG